MELRFFFYSINVFLGLFRLFVVFMGREGGEVGRIFIFYLLDVVFYWVGLIEEEKLRMEGRNFRGFL